MLLEGTLCFTSGLLFVYQVPAEVQVVAERYCKKRKSCRRTDEDIPLEQYSTFCKRSSPEDFHKAGKERAEAEVASLLELVMNMPDGPQKTHFLKRVNICAV